MSKNLHFVLVLSILTLFRAAVATIDVEDVVKEVLNNTKSDDLDSSMANTGGRNITSIELPENTGMGSDPATKFGSLVMPGPVIATDSDNKKPVEVTDPEPQLIDNGGLIPPTTDTDFSEELDSDDANGGVDDKDSKDEEKEPAVPDYDSYGNYDELETETAKPSMIDEGGVVSKNNSLEEEYAKLGISKAKDFDSLFMHNDSEDEDTSQADVDGKLEDLDEADQDKDEDYPEENEDTSDNSSEDDYDGSSENDMEAVDSNDNKDGVDSAADEDDMDKDAGDNSHDDDGNDKETVDSKDSQDTSNYEDDDDEDNSDEDNSNENDGDEDDDNDYDYSEDDYDYDYNSNDESDEKAGNGREKGMMTGNEEWFKEGYEDNTDDDGDDKTDSEISDDYQSTTESLYGFTSTTPWWEESYEYVDNENIDEYDEDFEDDDDDSAVSENEDKSKEEAEDNYYNEDEDDYGPKWITSTESSHRAAAANSDEWPEVPSEKSYEDASVQRSFQFTIILMSVLILTILAMLLYWNKAYVKRYLVFFRKPARPSVTTVAYDEQRNLLANEYP